MSNTIGAHHEVVSILVVDDDEIDARAVTRALRQACVDNPIVVARNGLEALDRLRGTDAQEPLGWPYIVLLDLNMPRMNGLEFLDALRNDPDLAHVVVFVLTTSDDDRDKVEAYRRNVAGYVLKTTVGSDFLSLVAMLERFVVTVRFPRERARAS